MSFWVQFFFISLLLTFLLYLLHLIMYRRFRERDSFLWICLVFLFLGMVIFYKFIDFIAQTLGIAHSFALVFLFGILFILIIIFWQSYRISYLTNSIIELAQKLALLEFILKEKNKDEHHHSKSSSNK